MPYVIKSISGQETPLKESSIRAQENVSNKPSKYKIKDIYGQKQSVPEEGEIKSNFRSILQLPLGLLKKFTYTADLIKASILESGREDMREMMREDPEMFNEEAFKKALESSSEYMPTQDFIEQYIESKTGAPLTPKTETQKKIRTATETASFVPGKLLSAASIPGRVVAAGAQPIGKDVLESMGVPENIAEPVSQVGAVALGSRTKIPSFKSTQSELSAAKAKSISPQKIPEKAPKIESAKQIQKDLGIEIPLVEKGRTYKQKIGKSISEGQFPNSSIGGKALHSEIQELDNIEYSKVNELYAKSRSLNKNIVADHPGLIKNIEQRLDDLAQIPSLSGPQKELQKSLNEVLDRISVDTRQGRIPSKISNQSLIDQITSLRHKIDYDFAHGSPKNIIKPFIKDIQESIKSTAASNPSAYKALKDADTSYAEWADKFDNDYVRHLRDRTNKSYTKSYKAATDIDEFVALKSTLNKSTKGQAILKSMQRDIVEEKLSKFIHDPKKIGSEEFEKTMSELSIVLDENQMTKLEKTIREGRHPLGPRQTKKIPKTAKEKLLSYLRKPEVQKKAIKEVLKVSGSAYAGNLVKKVLESQEE